MKYFWESYLRNNIAFFILGGVSLLLIIVSWIAPPPMQIHGSVLQAVAELFAFASLWAVVLAIEKGTGASLRKGDVELEIQEAHDDKQEKEVEL